MTLVPPTANPGLDRVLLLGPGAAALAVGLRSTHGVALPEAGWVWEAHDTPADLEPAVQALAGERLRLLLLVADHPEAANAALEQAFRQTLNGLGVAHQIIYPLAGSHAAAVRQALRLGPAPQRRSRPRWACQDCLDPVCEHRLFQDLLAQRAHSVTGAGPSPAAAAAG